MKSIVGWSLITVTTLCLSQAWCSRASDVGITQQTNRDNASLLKGTEMEITESEARRIAERFVARNGYTESPPSAEDSAIVYEASDPSDRDLALRWRSDTLEPKAYAARRREEPPGWIVVFRYNAANTFLRGVVPTFDEHVRQWGRAVVMDWNGDNVRLEHQDVKLDYH